MDDEWMGRGECYSKRIDVLLFIPPCRFYWTTTVYATLITLYIVVDRRDFFSFFSFLLFDYLFFGLLPGKMIPLHIMNAYVIVLVNRLHGVSPWVWWVIPWSRRISRLPQEGGGTLDRFVDVLTLRFYVTFPNSPVLIYRFFLLIFMIRKCIFREYPGRSSVPWDSRDPRRPNM